MDKKKIIDKHNLTKDEKAKLLKNKASSAEIKSEISKVLIKRINAIKNLSGK